MILSRNSQAQIQLEKRPPSGIWGGLWSLPEITTTNENSKQAKQSKLIGKFKHTFSHYHLEATVFAGDKTQASTQRVEDKIALAWHNVSEVSQLALPTPIKKFLYQHLKIEEK